MPPEDNLTETEVTELLNYDPFAEAAAKEESTAAPAEEKAEAAEGDGATAVPAIEAPPAAVAPVPTSTPSEKTGSEGAVEVGILQRLVETQARQIEALTKAIADRDGRKEGGDPSPPGKPTPSAVAVPGYDFDIPDELVDAISAEDPRVRKMALRALVKGTATAIHQEMMREIEPKLKEIPLATEASLSARQAQIAQRDAVLRDFYEKFPELAKEELSPFLANVAQKVMVETGISSWNETLRDAVGNRARQILGMALPAAPVGKVVKPAVPAPPPAMAGSNTRPPNAASGRAVDEVWDLVMGR